MVFFSAVFAFMLLVCNILKRDIEDQGLYSLSDLDSLIYIAVAFSTQSQLTHHISDKQPDGCQFTSGRSGVLSQTVLNKFPAISNLQKFQGLLQLTSCKSWQCDFRLPWVLYLKNSQQEVSNRLTGNKSQAPTGISFLVCINYWCTSLVLETGCLTVIRWYISRFWVQWLTCSVCTWQWLPAAFLFPLGYPSNIKCLDGRLNQIWVQCPSTWLIISDA